MLRQVLVNSIYLNTCIILYIMMATGIIITYKISRAQDITKLTNELFGRVVTIKRDGTKHLYYYSGLFEGVNYIKLSNGCYFISVSEEFYSNSTFVESHINTLNVYKVNGLEIDGLTTPEEYFAIYYRNHEVNNLG